MLRDFVLLAKVRHVTGVVELVPGLLGAQPLRLELCSGDGELLPAVISMPWAHTQPLLS